MQLRSENNKTKLFGKLVVRSTINYTIILFLAIIFSIQSLFSFAAINNGNNLSDSILTVSSNFENHYISYFSPLSHQTDKKVWINDAEDQIAEEDDNFDTADSSISDQTNSTHSNLEFRLTKNLNSFYLKREAFSHIGRNLPLFILHHSWKNYISC